MTKILLHYIHYPVASGVYIKRAFKRLGYDVRSMGHSTKNEIWNLKVDPKHEQHQDYTEDFDPDLIVLCESAYALDKTGEPPFCCTPRVLFGADNHVRGYFPSIDYSAMFFCHTWGARMDEPNAHWLPACYDEDVHKDLGLERSIGVGMVGVTYQNRVDIILAMQQANVDVAAGIGLLWEDYATAYNQCKISLVKSSCGDLPQRFLESMAMGCCVLSDRLVDADKLGFVAGVDYWPYETPEEAVKESQYLLETGKWQEIAENGKRKVQGHTWTNRVKLMMETLTTKGIVKGN